MVVRRHTIIKSLNKIFNDINQDSDDILPFFHEKTISDISWCIAILGEEGGAYTLQTPKVERCSLVTVVANGNGLYDIYLTRESRKIHARRGSRSVYGGILSGAFKEYKSGLMRIVVEEQSASRYFYGNGCLDLIDYAPMLSLVKKSKAYKALFLSDDLERSFSEENLTIEEKLLTQGFDPSITTIIQRPRIHDPKVFSSSVFVIDLGEPLGKLSLIKTLNPKEDYIKIAIAISDAGKKNPPTYLPFDVKLANIVMRNTKHGNEFTVIDFSFPSCTTLYLSEKIKAHTGRTTRFSFAILTEISKGKVDKPLSNKPEITIRQSVYYITANAIISAFICIMSAPYLISRDQLRDSQFMRILKARVYFKLNTLPSLFDNLDVNLAGSIRECLIPFNEDMNREDDFNWEKILLFTFREELS